MFTGLVEETGRVEALRIAADGTMKLRIAAPWPSRTIRIGDSIAVNGCCLTAVKISKKDSGCLLDFDLLHETVNRTTFGQAVEGDFVNLERSMGANSGLHGHFVTGHIDGVGKIVRWEEHDGDWILGIKAPAELKRLFVEKGSVAVDGISLTIARLTRGGFETRIIPHTRAVTNLAGRKESDFVNLEPDMIAKYVEHFLSLKLHSRRGR
jgi:riboflavin synthase